nr:MAG TPA: Integrase [Caudoviricetes sp.]
MICRKCKADVPDGLYCSQCGAKQAQTARNPKSRGNGQGSVYRLPNGKYKALRVQMYLDAEGKSRRHTVSRTFARKKDAVEALPLLDPSRRAAVKEDKKRKTTWKQLYDLWLPTHRAGPDTLGNYKAAIKYFAPLYHERCADIDVDDLQDCIDDCPRGKSTRRNMRTTAGLIYKYGIPRGYFPDKLNLAEYLTVTGEEGAGGVGLPPEYMTKLWDSSGKVPGVDYVLAQCYLGFRPSEFLALDVSDYDRARRCFVGGAKTSAGKDRTVTISPKIQPIIDRQIGERTAGQVFRAADGSDLNLKAYRQLFYGVLDALKLANPTFDVNGQRKHTYTPHSCRHTFATLLKRVQGADKDKLELIGHASDEQLRYYQDVNLDDLRKITDQI